jgi:hypothetical protein
MNAHGQYHKPVARSEDALAEAAKHNLASEAHLGHLQRAQVHASLAVAAATLAITAIVPTEDDEDPDAAH